MREGRLLYWALMSLQLRQMRVREAKDFLVQQTAEQAVLENVPLSDLEKRMMYFTETGECPEDPIALNDAFEAEYDTTTYEKKLSRLMAAAYRRIKRENPEKLHLWNKAFRVLGDGDHYVLLFWRQKTFRKPSRMWKTYVLGALGAASLYLVIILFFGTKGGMKRGEQPPIDRYLPPLSPMTQHILQLLFLLAFLFAVFPQLFSKLASLVRREKHD
jgi:hypothetical protein